MSAPKARDTGVMTFKRGWPGDPAETKLNLRDAMRELDRLVGRAILAALDDLSNPKENLRQIQRSAKRLHSILDGAVVEVDEMVKHSTPAATKRAR